MTEGDRDGLRNWVNRHPLFQGIRPIERSRIPLEIIAGLTLAAVCIPQAIGYTRIAGMPLVTGLYTILIPLALFSIFGSSRHLVIGADSASAAILAVGLMGVAVAGSAQYVALASTLALLTGLLLFLSRLLRMGFLADFLSRTVMVGLFTGVGIDIAIGEIGGMLGLPGGGGAPLRNCSMFCSSFPA
jgi:sulfate permease, SulP family